MSSPLPLRAHHGLCAQYFIGKGYSPEFVNNMREIIGRLEGGVEVKLLAECDLICSRCPNKNSAVCRDAEKVYTLDRKTLTAAKICEGEVLDSREFLRVIRERVIDAGKQREVCGGCEWSELCGLG